MNTSIEHTTTDLLELAKASWNPALLVPCRPDLVATRPLLILVQWAGDDDLEPATIDDRIRFAVEQMAHTASISQFIEPHEGVAVMFLAGFHGGYPITDAMFDDEGELRVAPDIREALALPAPSTDLENGGEEQAPLGQLSLLTIIVLPDADDQEIDLKSIEEAIPDFTGWAFWYDTSNDVVKYQSSRRLKA